MARRRFFVDEVREGRARIAGDEAHHLTRVLRVEAGQTYEISDNRNVYLAEIEAARKDLVTFAIVDQLAAGKPPSRTTLFASLIRFERFEWMMEKATELGVQRVVPVQSARSEKGLDLAAAKRAARWNRVAREASEQSRRTRLPEIATTLRYSEAIRTGVGHCLALDEAVGAQPILLALPVALLKDHEVSILVGPEGGWTDQEREAFLARGWRAVSLGNTILKAETAAVAALAIVNAACQAAT